MAHERWAPVLCYELYVHSRRPGARELPRGCPLRCIYFQASDQRHTIPLRSGETLRWRSRACSGALAWAVHSHPPSNRAASARRRASENAPLSEQNQSQGASNHLSALFLLVSTWLSCAAQVTVPLELLPITDGEQAPGSGLKNYTKHQLKQTRRIVPMNRDLRARI